MNGRPYGPADCDAAGRARHDGSPLAATTTGGRRERDRERQLKEERKQREREEALAAQREREDQDRVERRERGPGSSRETSLSRVGRRM